MNEWLRQLLFLPPQSSTVAASVDGLHYFVILTTLAGALAITLIGGYFLVRYRADGRYVERGVPKSPVLLEGGAVVILFSLFITWWAIGFGQYVRIRVAPENALDIYVTAKQWMWEFGYSDGQQTISKLYVPARRPVKLIMTSRDVIHSFFVPEFRIKQDVLPGRYVTAWFEVIQPGTYQILCTEFCGVGHSTMRGEVVALDPADYERWLRRGGAREEPNALEYVEPAVVDDFTRAKAPSLLRVGEEVAAQEGCLRCHTLDGSPHIGPTWAGLYRSKIPLEDGSTVIADEGYLTESMMDPMAKIHRGFQRVMPSYQGILRPEEASAMIELIKSLKQVPARPAGTPPPAGPELHHLLPDRSLPPIEEEGLPPPGAQIVPPIPGRIEVKPTAPRSPRGGGKR